MIQGNALGVPLWYSLLWSLLRLLGGKIFDQIYKPMHLPHSDAATPAALNENTMTNLGELLSRAGVARDKQCLLKIFSGNLFLGACVKMVI